MRIAFLHPMLIKISARMFGFNERIVPAKDIARAAVDLVLTLECGTSTVLLPPPD
jgi:hypothetical protein